MKTVYALVAAGVVFSVVGIHEYNYRAAHPYAHGVSGELIALAVAGAVVAFALAAYVFRTEEDRKRREAAVWERISGLQASIGSTAVDPPVSAE